ncbi:3-hydroxyacyl-CoA dehydrogenase NAD-binding domain-containing protein [Lentzea sp. NPDC060358]|uniref:3-hydroxyacyl-CoA dehydrogenase NAD-binding domain-containing protein n=1 Tax=Lentzea sp. NPDC060358 TaxID=3347103 RepID=UPI003652B82B
MASTVLLRNDAGKLDGSVRDAALRRLIWTTDLVDLADRHLVIEAVAEDESAKLEVFRRVNEVVISDEAILATNTSSIPVMKLAMTTWRPANLVGVHFFNPVTVLDLVELVPSLVTSAEPAQRTKEFTEKRLAKRVVRVQDRAGFVVNALLVPYVLDAIRMVESGFACGVPELCSHTLTCGDQFCHPAGMIVGVALRCDCCISSLFGSVLAEAGIDVVKIRPRCSRANCHAERFVGTVRRELTDRLLFVNQRHLTSVQYPLRIPLQPDHPTGDPGCRSGCRRRRVLGGLINKYEPAAA